MMVKVTGLEANLTGAIMNGAKLQRAELTQSRFDNAEMNGVDDQEAVFDESSFEGALR
jgi:uncharacterized protein YjbI with pentapeptide repeats